jgi:DNA mismatch endonuclease (patch repair protein)
MRANKRTNTKPELALRSALHRQGYRFRKDYRLDLAGGARVRPDIAFTARRVAVFVDGCFWHACPDHGRNPTVNEWYWAPKLRRNVERDRAADAALAAAGWRVIRVWEHEALETAITAVIAALGPLVRPLEPPLGPPGPFDGPADTGNDPREPFAGLRETGNVTLS